MCYLRYPLTKFNSSIDLGSRLFVSRVNYVLGMHPIHFAGLLFVLSQTGRAHLLLISDYPGEPRGALGVVTLEGEINEY